MWSLDGLPALLPWLFSHKERNKNCVWSLGVMCHTWKNKSYSKSDDQLGSVTTKRLPPPSSVNFTVQTASSDRYWEHQEVPATVWMVGVCRNFCIIPVDHGVNFTVHRCGEEKHLQLEITTCQKDLTARQGNFFFLGGSFHSIQEEPTVIVFCWAGRRCNTNFSMIET